MVALIIEFSLVVSWFLWLRHRQMRARAQARPLPPRQLRFGFEDRAPH